jgi:putative FmdB family regulatory protein
MPLYEYVCPKCNAQASVLHRQIERGQKAKHVCESCGHKPMRRLFSTFAFRPSGTATKSQVDKPAQATTPETPQALAQTMRQAARCRDMGAEFNEVAGRLEKGERAPSVETSLRKRKRQKAGPH